ncbi:cytochrome C assembly family protein [Lysobacter soyae]|uniref:Cytochrome c biogenesis protein CcsA n=1 Tax=Lysobacter soyae TaxID=2764185 RepID=A0ABX8WLC8_9GAMM|nr:cytochrome c biogenesis protein CcsA [Lysobacter sp. CJ11]QYR52435.1 cytochrome c biogenesis protein CcsA [Lysobacter sp. CJ11]
MIMAYLSLLLYCIATGVLGRSLARPAGDGNRWWLPIVILAMVFHGEIHAEAWRSIRGVDLRFYSTLSLTALGIAALTTALSLRGKLAAAGILMYPLAGLLALRYAAQGHGHPTQMDWQLQLHAWCAISAYVTLAVATLIALLLWFQERALRRHRVQTWTRVLPPLTDLERLLFQAILVGYVLLTATLVTGVVFVHDLFAQHIVHKTVLSVLSWLVFGILLIGRWRYGWRGARAVRWTLAAMILLLLAFFGTQFVRELILNRV